MPFLCSEANCVFQIGQRNKCGCSFQIPYNEILHIVVMDSIRNQGNILLLSQMWNIAYYTK